MNDAVTPSTTIRPRSPAFPFGTQIPRHWFGGNPIATHIVNGVNLLFPAGERFFVRSVRHYMDRIDDPELQAKIRGFFGQEGRHAHAHEEFFEVLSRQGFKLERFLEIYERIAYAGIERIAPPALRLSVTAACEHYTAILADRALRLGLLEYADPTVRTLLLWHAAEEIEHKAVAFDVLKRVNPSYALRMAGLAVGTLCLVSFWFAAAITLMRQDDLRRAHVRQSWQQLQERESLGRRVFWDGIRDYMRRDFHPNDKDNAALAARYLASAGLA